MRRKIAGIITVILVLCMTVVAVSADYTPQYTAYADRLNALGLFQGTGTGSDGRPIYALNREATRAEALTMLIRLMGEEVDAKNYTGSNPFTDVTGWATKYVTYAYSKGYTAGATATTFNPNGSATANMYLTFLLRALGYSDINGDFKYSAAYTKAAEVGICQSGQYASGTFYRDDCAYTSYQALTVNMKGTASSLVQTLIGKGAVSAAYAETFGLIKGADTGGGKTYLLVKQTDNYSNSIEYSYDSGGKLISKLDKNKNGDTVSYKYTYDSYGNVLTETFQNAGGRIETDSHKYTYYPGGRIKTDVYSDAGYDGVRVSKLEYVYDANGRVSSMTETGEYFGMKYTYTYDAFGNLLKSRGDNLYIASNILIKEYTYDAFGNPLTYSSSSDGKLDETFKYTYTYDAAGEILTMDDDYVVYYSDSDKAVGHDRAEYVNGNCVRKQGDNDGGYLHVYTYDGNGCMTSWKRYNPDGVTLDIEIRYEYKAL